MLRTHLPDVVTTTAADAANKVKNKIWNGCSSRGGHDVEWSNPAEREATSHAMLIQTLKHSMEMKQIIYIVQ